VELAHEGREAGFMILAIEPCLMPSSKRSFQGKIEEAITRAGLETYAPNNLLVGKTQLVFQEEVAFEKWGVGRNPKENLTKMDKNGDLKNGVRVKMNKLDLVVVQESMEEIPGRETEPALEEEVNTTISFVLGVRMSSPVAWRHCSTARSGRKWLATSLQISLSSEMDGWNRCGCKAAMAREKDYGEHEGGARVEAESTEKLKEK
jgi:hypothetical protein